VKSLIKKFRIIYSYRFFISELIKKDFKIRYTQSYLGLSWIILEPLITSITLSAIFVLAGRKGKEGIPFPIFFYSGVIIWGLFKHALTTGPKVFIKNKDLITKINYPRWLSIFTSINTNIFDFIFANISFIILLIYYGYRPNMYYIYLPFLIMLIVLLSFGLHLIFSSINVFVRDTEKLTGIAATVWFWFTPIIFHFPFDGKTKIIYYVNPVAGIISNYRSIIAFGNPPQFELLYSSLIGIFLFNTVGFFIFKKLSKNFADVI
jgi:ABC-type polysaccharide/polyol phosphate export permease